MTVVATAPGGYEVRTTSPVEQYGQFVACGNRLLAAVGNDTDRAWVFPLCTPSGRGVTQESSFDHTFHRSIFIGQGDVHALGRRANYWAVAGDYRFPDSDAFHNLGSITYGPRPEVTMLAAGARFTYRSVWRDTTHEPVIDEIRTIDVFDAGDATVCDTRTERTSAYGDVTYAKTKYGSIGVRVQPQLLPLFGAEVLGLHDGTLRRGNAEEAASGQPCEWVAYESSEQPPGSFGVAMSILDNSLNASRTGPWLIRDYGMAMFNATMDESFTVPEGQTWTAGLRVVAYDGAVTPQRLAAWGELEPGIAKA